MVQRELTLALLPAATLDETIALLADRKEKLEAQGNFQARRRPSHDP